MSVLFWTVVPTVVYAILGIGTARKVYADRYRRAFRHWEAKRKAVVRGMHDSPYNYLTFAERRVGNSDPHALARGDSSVYGPAMVAGAAWPVAVTWLLLVKPIGTVVWPVVGRWWFAPALRATARDEATS